MEGEEGQEDLGKVGDMEKGIWKEDSGRRLGRSWGWREGYRRRGRMGEMGGVGDKKGVWKERKDGRLGRGGWRMENGSLRKSSHKRQSSKEQPDKRFVYCNIKSVGLFNIYSIFFLLSKVKKSTILLYHMLNLKI